MRYYKKIFARVIAFALTFAIVFGGQTLAPVTAQADDGDLYLSFDVQPEDLAYTEQYYAGLYKLNEEP